MVRITSGDEEISTDELQDDETTQYGEELGGDPAGDDGGLPDHTIPGTGEVGGATYTGDEDTSSGSGGGGGGDDASGGGGGDRGDDFIKDTEEAVGGIHGGTAGQPASEGPGTPRSGPTDESTAGQTDVPGFSLWRSDPLADDEPSEPEPTDGSSQTQPTDPFDQFPTTGRNEPESSEERRIENQLVGLSPLIGPGDVVFVERGGRTVATVDRTTAELLARSGYDPSSALASVRPGSSRPTTGGAVGETGGGEDLPVALGGVAVSPPGLLVQTAAGGLELFSTLGEDTARPRTAAERGAAPRPDSARPARVSPQRRARGEAALEAAIQEELGQNVDIEPEDFVVYPSGSVELTQQGRDKVATAETTAFVASLEDFFGARELEDRFGLPAGSISLDPPGEGPVARDVGVERDLGDVEEAVGLDEYVRSAEEVTGADLPEGTIEDYGRELLRPLQEVDAEGAVEGTPFDREVAGVHLAEPVDVAGPVIAGFAGGTFAGVKDLFDLTEKTYRDLARGDAVGARETTEAATQALVNRAVLTGEGALRDPEAFGKSVAVSVPLSVLAFQGASALGGSTGSQAARLLLQPGEEFLGYGGYGVTRAMAGERAAQRYFPNREPLIFSEEAAIRAARRASTRGADLLQGEAGFVRRGETAFVYDPGRPGIRAQLGAARDRLGGRLYSFPGGMLAETETEASVRPEAETRSLLDELEGPLRRMEEASERRAEEAAGRARSRFDVETNPLRERSGLPSTEAELEGERLRRLELAVQPQLQAQSYDQFLAARQQTRSVQRPTEIERLVELYDLDVDLEAESESRSETGLFLEPYAEAEAEVEVEGVAESELERPETELLGGGRERSYPWDVDTGGFGGAVGEPDVDLGSGWGRETIVAHALGAGVREAPDQGVLEQYADAPFEQRPTQVELTGTEEQLAAIEEAEDFFTFGGGDEEGSVWDLL